MELEQVGQKSIFKGQYKRLMDDSMPILLESSRKISLRRLKTDADVANALDILNI
jgi:hypothetical protein